MSQDVESMEDKVLLFDDGIPGFPRCKQFVLVDMVEDGAFQLFQSVDDEEVAMVVCVPWIFFPDYALELTTVEQEDLDIADLDEAVVFCPVTFDPEESSFHLNLLGPFVVNTRTRRGRQLVLTDSQYPLRATVRVGSA